MRREAGAGLDAGLMVILAFSVFAFGSTSYWARTLLMGGIAALFASWWLCTARSRPPVEFEPESRSRGVEIAGVRLRRSGLGVVAAAFGGIVCLQLVPLPRVVRGWLSPGRAALEVPLEAVLGESAAPEAGPSWAPLSLDASGTVDALLLLLAYGALFVLVFNLADSRERLVRICRSVALLGASVAVVGLFQDLSGAERIYGFWTPRYGGSPYGPFVNHNHFAGYMELTIPVAVGLLLRRIFRGSAPPRAIAAAPPSGPGSAARRMLEVAPAVRGERAGQAVLLGLAVGVMVAALLLCLSRGGLASLVVAAAAVLALLALGGRLGRWEVAALGAVLALGVTLFLWIGPGPALAHFRRAELLQNEPSFLGRASVWRATLSLFLDFPVLGSGFGTFPAAFLHYYPAGTERIWLQAHNDYVQLLAETGLAGAAVAAVGLALLLAHLLRPLILGPPVRERFLYFGLVTGILSLLVHSLVDFNLQIPANATLFVVLCALALAHRSLLARGERPAAEG